MGSKFDICIMTSPDHYRCWIPTSGFKVDVDNSLPANSAGFCVACPSDRTSDGGATFVCDQCSAETTETSHTEKEDPTFHDKVPNFVATKYEIQTFDRNRERKGMER